MVKSDMIGNTDSIWRHTTGASGETLDALCNVEVEAVGTKKAFSTDGSVSTSLLWLRRALGFIEAIMKALIQKPVKSMKACCHDAYQTSLARYHNVLMKSAFKVAVNAAPNRVDFLRTLAPTSTTEAALDTLGRLLPSFSKLLSAVDHLLRAQGIQK